MKSRLLISRVLYPLRGALSFIYSASHPAAQAFYPPSQSETSDEQPSNDGIHELATSRRHSPTIARRLVVSYTTFSPLPDTRAVASTQFPVVIFFCLTLLSPIASIFGSGALCVARTFLSSSRKRASGRAGNLLFFCKNS